MVLDDQLTRESSYWVLLSQSYCSSPNLGWIPSHASLSLLDTWEEDSWKAGIGAALFEAWASQGRKSRVAKCGRPIGGEETESKDLNGLFPNRSRCSVVYVNSYPRSLMLCCPLIITEFLCFHQFESIQFLITNCSLWQHSWKNIYPEWITMQVLDTPHFLFNFDFGSSKFKLIMGQWIFFIYANLPFLLLCYTMVSFITHIFTFN